MADRGRNGDSFDRDIHRRVDEALENAEEKFGPEIEKQIEAEIGDSIEDKVRDATSTKLGTFGLHLKPARIELHPLMETDKVKSADDFADDRVPDELQDLLDNPPTLTGKATEDTDGRLVPVLLAIVHDRDGATRAGIELRLLDTVSKVLLDRTRTDAGGLALLRFPNRAGENEEVEGKLSTAGLDDPLDVTIPEGVQHLVIEVVLDSLPEVPTVNDPTTGEETAEIPTGDDLLERLPADFSPALSDAIQRLRGTTPDPILGKVAAPGDFRSRRTPLIKRLTIPRLGVIPVEGAPRRYLVRVRQEWSFLGYTLGELSGVEALDPGTIVQATTETVQRTLERASRSADEVLSQTTQLMRSVLTQASSIDTLLTVATSTEARASASLGVSGNTTTALLGGVAGALLAGPAGAVAGGLLGGLFGGAGVRGGVGTGLSTSTTTTSAVDTSLEVNSMLHTAKSVINQTVRTAASTLRDIQSTVLRQVDQVSPLLSRVTNLLRWTMYENYAVVTRVEDVVEVKAVRITEPERQRVLPLFSDEDIVEYRRYFEPALLEPRLRPHFDILRDAISERIAGGTPISTIHAEVDYSAAVFGADLKVTIGALEIELELRPGATSARGSLRIPPTRPAQLQRAKLSLAARMPSFSGIFGAFASVIDQVLSNGGVQVSRIRFWYENTPVSPPDQTESLGESLAVSNDSRTGSVDVTLQVPVRLTDTTKDPLFRHVNRNRTYYFGVIAQAALSNPALRDDAPELGDFNGDHALWRLPLVGFEGDRVLVISDVARDEAGEVTDEDVKRLLEDPGAATIIQLAAPGAYAEALQGLLELTGDVAGKIHPALLPPLPATVPPLAIMDLTGKKLQVVDGLTPGVPVPPGP